MESREKMENEYNNEYGISDDYACKRTIQQYFDLHWETTKIMSES